MEIKLKLTEKAAKFFNDKATAQGGVSVSDVVSLAVEALANENQPVEPKSIPELMRFKGWLDNHYHDPACRQLAYMLKFFVEGKPIPKVKPNPIAKPTEESLFSRL